MDYATTNRRAATAARKQKAAITAPTNGAVPARDAAQARCRRGAAGHPSGSTCGAAAHAFLKCRFLPHYTGQETAADPQQETEFFASFALLCSHYGISVMDTSILGYPYSREVALWDAQRKLRAACEQSIGIGSIIVEGNFSLTAAETYCTGNTLYYIPVVPLHRLINRRRTRKGAQLLLGICAYLYHVAGVPYYREDSSYLCWQYDMIGQWVKDDPEGWEQEHYWQNRSQLHTAEHIGDVMQRRLWNRYSLDRLAGNTEKFLPLDSFGSSCLHLADAALRLWGDYPDAHLWRNADQSVLPDPESYEDGDCITMDKYIGFCADTDGWLYHTLSECVNNEFNECVSIQEPVLQRIFDGREQATESLDFECRLFRLMDDLCGLLNEYGNGSK